MRARLSHLWEVLNTGYWFVPALMTLSSAILAIMLVFIDRKMSSDGRIGWLYSGGADGAKTLLSTVAGSVITVAGVVFSITIASLTQASSQFGPRLLRNFMRDTSNQVVLGTFVATFLYCLLVLRTIHGDVMDGKAFVPQASVTAAVLMAIASLAVLIYFIHHVSVSLQAPAVIASARADLSRVIARLPENPESADSETRNGLPSQFDDTARMVAATVEGYVQVVDFDGLMAAATKGDLVLRLAYRSGDYIIRGTPLLHLSPADRWNQEMAAAMNGAFICGIHGTPEQDIEYAIRQIVEVAVRALSPGINDPFTAMNCIDALGSALCDIARRKLPDPHRYDEQEALRLVARVATFDGIADTAFNQIRQYGMDSVAVTLRLLEIIARCAGQMTNHSQRQSLAHHAEMIHRQSQTAFKDEGDRADIRQRWEAAAGALGDACEASELIGGAPTSDRAHAAQCE